MWQNLKINTQKFSIFREESIRAPFSFTKIQNVLCKRLGVNSLKGPSLIKRDHTQCFCSIASFCSDFLGTGSNFKLQKTEVWISESFCSPIF